MTRPAVILMAYGSPDRLSDVPAYYADIRGGRPIRPELLDDLVERYRGLGIDDSGNPSPLNVVTEQTRAALEERLGLSVFTGMRHWEPRIAAAVDRAIDEGHDALVGLVLAPHWSSLSIAKYQGLFADAVAGRVATSFVREWGSEDGFIELLADRVRGTEAHVVFTAHSLPARIVDAGDTYRDSLLETAQLVAESARLPRWSFSFQSESQTGEPWLGPDILDHLETLRDEGVSDVLVCPVGFVSEHLEIRWDIDVEAVDRARELGLRLSRIEMPNAEPALVGVLASLVQRELGSPRMTPGAIDVKKVSRRFMVRARDTQTLKELVIARGRTDAQEVWALRDVSLAIAPGEAVGLVGRNGSGKSTLLRLIAEIIKPTSGTVETSGRVGSLLELGAGFHPDFTGRENVELNGALQGLSRARIRERFDEIVAFAELEHAIDRPVRTYSSGMTMRLGFSIAAFLEADILLLDEVFAVGDESFQRKCFGVISAFKQRGGTILFVSHEASAVERLCDRAVLLRDGNATFDGSVHEALAHYRRGLVEDETAGRTAIGVPAVAEITGARLVGADGAPRETFLSGEPLRLELAISVHAPESGLAIQLNVRDTAGLLVVDDLAVLEQVGWDGRAGAFTLRLDVTRPPLDFGRLRLELALLGGDGRLLHRADDEPSLLVYPDGAGRGLVRLEGTWRAFANENAT